VLISILLPIVRRSMTERYAGGLERVRAVRHRSTMILRTRGSWCARSGSRLSEGWR